MKPLWKTILLPGSILLLTTILVSLPMFQQNMDIYRDDGVQHITRLMGTMQTIMEGQFPPMVMSAFCNGFGYSWNLFYSPISAYVPLLFLFIGFSYIGSIKSFLFLMLFLSGVSMYAFTKKVTNRQGIALLAALFYITMPYHINDIYNRVAIAEVASFVFLPMVFHGLYKVLHKESIGVLVAGAVGMLLSHTVLTLYTAIMALVYLVVSIRKTDGTTWKKLFASTALVLLLTSFYWAPMLESRLAADYEVFKPGRMSSLVDIQQQSNSLVDHITPIDLVYDYHNIMGSYSINLLVIIGVLATPFCFKKVQALPYRALYWTLGGLGFVSLIMCLSFFPFDKLPEILQMLQFQFRMQEFVALCFSFIAAVNIALCIKDIGKKEYIALGIMIIITTAPVIYRWNTAKEELTPEEAYWPAVAVTENTGRVHAGCASFEYLPCRAFENREYIVKRSAQPIVLQGNAQIANFTKEGCQATMEIQGSQGADIELPYIYYIGYTITIETQGETIHLEPTESENGFVQVHIPALEEGSFTIDYTGTLGMQIAYGISATTLVGIGSWCLYRKMRNKDRRKEKIENV